MQRRPEPRRGLALLLAERRADESALPLAQTLSRRLGHEVTTRLGLRIAFAADEGGGDYEQLELGPGVEARYLAGDALATLRFSQAAVFDLIEAVFGGDGSNPAWREMRGPTMLERLVIAGAAQALAEPLGEAFGAAGLVYDGLEDRPGAPREGGVEIALRMQALGRQSVVVLRAPSAWRGDDGEPRREVSRGSLRDRLGEVEIPLRVLLRDRSRSLADVADLREGQILPLAATSRTPALLEADGVGLFLCGLGQSEGRYTVQIESAAGARPFP